MQIKSYSQILGHVGALSKMRTQMHDLDRQLGTLKRSETYGGLGTGRSAALSMRAEISRVEGYRSTIDTVSTRVNVQATALERLSGIERDAKTSAYSRGLNVSGGTLQVVQTGALQSLQETVDLLNQDVGGRYLFSGRTTDERPVASVASLLEGEVGRPGFRQVLKDRLAADDASGMGKLAVASSGAAATLTRAGSPGFGLTLNAASIKSPASVTPAAVAGPPPGTSFSFGAAPAPGDTVSMTFKLPDGTDRQVALTASTAPKSDGEFKIGAAGPARATSGAIISGLGATLASAGVADGDDLTISDGTSTFTYTVGSAATETFADIEAQLALPTSPVDAGLSVVGGQLVITSKNSTEWLTIGGTAAGATKLGYSPAPNAPAAVTATAQNFAQALEREIGKLAKSDLAGVSAFIAADGFFPADGGAPKSTAGATALGTVAFATAAAGLTSGVSTLTISDGGPAKTFTYDAGSSTGLSFTSLPGLIDDINGQFDTLWAAEDEAGNLRITARDPSTNLTLGGDVRTALGYAATSYPAGSSFVASDPETALSWYKGESIGGARGSVTARIDDAISVNYGVRANEKPIVNVLATLAVMGTMDLTSLAPSDNARRHDALMGKVQERLATSGKTATIANVVAELAVADQALDRAKVRLGERRAIAQDLVAQVEDVDKAEVIVQLQELQNRLEASYNVTSTLSRLSLVNFLN